RIAPMKFLSFGRLFGKQRHGKASSVRRARVHRATRTGRASLGLEALEDRTLMSVIPTPVINNHFDISSSQGNHNTPSIAVDPTNPQDLVAVYTRNDPAHLPTATPVIIEGWYSTDGGNSWNFLSGLSSNANLDFTVAPGNNGIPPLPDAT